MTPSNATFALRAVTNSIPFTPEQMAAVDINQDGQMTIPDVLLILRFALGDLSTFR